MKARGKAVRGEDYAADLDEYEKKKKKKLADSSKTAGMAEALRKSEKQTGYSKKPRVKPQKKMNKLKLNLGEVY